MKYHCWSMNYAWFCNYTFSCHNDIRAWVEFWLGDGLTVVFDFEMSNYMIDEMSIVGW